MTNKDFIELYRTCEGASQAMFNIVGLRCKRFTRHCSEIFEKIKEEELGLFYKYGQKEANVYKTNEKGTIIIPADSQKEFLSEFNKLHVNSLSSIDLHLIDLFEKLPTISDDILKDLPPSLFEILNKYIFDISDEEYLTAIHP